MRIVVIVAYLYSIQIQYQADRRSIYQDIDTLLAVLLPIELSVDSQG